MVKTKNRDIEMSRSYDRGASKGTFEINDKTRFNKRFLNQVPTKFNKTTKDRVTSPRSQG